MGCAPIKGFSVFGCFSISSTNDNNAASRTSDPSKEKGDAGRGNNSGDANNTNVNGPTATAKEREKLERKVRQKAEREREREREREALERGRHVEGSGIDDRASPLDEPPSPPAPLLSPQARRASAGDAEHVKEIRERKPGKGKNKSKKSSGKSKKDKLNPGSGGTGLGQKLGSKKDGTTPIIKNKHHTASFSSSLAHNHNFTPYNNNNNLQPTNLPNPGSNNTTAPNLLSAVPPSYDASAVSDINISANRVSFFPHFSFNHDDHGSSELEAERDETEEKEDDDDESSISSTEMEDDISIRYTTPTMASDHVVRPLPSPSSLSIPYSIGSGLRSTEASTISGLQQTNSNIHNVNPPLNRHRSAPSSSTSMNFFAMKSPSNELADNGDSLSPGSSTNPSIAASPTNYSLGTNANPIPSFRNIVSIVDANSSHSRHPSSSIYAHTHHLYPHIPGDVTTNTASVNNTLNAIQINRLPSASSSSSSLPKRGISSINTTDIIIDTSNVSQSSPPHQINANISNNSTINPNHSNQPEITNKRLLRKARNYLQNKNHSTSSHSPNDSDSDLNDLPSTAQMRASLSLASVSKSKTRGNSSIASANRSPIDRKEFSREERREKDRGERRKVDDDIERKEGDTNKISQLHISMYSVSRSDNQLEEDHQGEEEEEEDDNGEDEEFNEDDDDGAGENVLNGDNTVTKDEIDHDVLSVKTSGLSLDSISLKNGNGLSNLSLNREKEEKVR